MVWQGGREVGHILSNLGWMAVEEGFEVRILDLNVPVDVDISLENL